MQPCKATFTATQRSVRTHKAEKALLNVPSKADNCFNNQGLWQKLTPMHRLARFAGPGSNLFHAAGGVHGALVRQFATLSMLPNSSWPFHLLPEAHQQACQILPQNPADLWQHTTGLAASAAITDSSRRSWSHAPALPSQLQAAADLAQIQQMSGTGEADLGTA